MDRDRQPLTFTDKVQTAAFTMLLCLSIAAGLAIGSGVVLFLKGE